MAARIVATLTRAAGSADGPFMAPFRSRLEAFVQVLHSLPATRMVELDIQPPRTEDEIARVHERLGFELDDRF